MQRHGIPGAKPVDRWAGSVDDGILYLRSFARIVLAPECRHTLAECQSYSFRIDPKTNLPIAKPVDANNHVIDSIRYGLSPLIRNQQSCTYFSRAALLVKGEPVEPSAVPPGYARRVFVTLAQCDRPGTALAAITWAYSPRHAWTLTVLDYELAEVEEALTGEWLMALLERAHELVEACGPLSNKTIIHIEDRQLFDAFGAVLVTDVVPHDPIYASGGSPLYDIERVEARDVRNAERVELVGLDERCSDLRTAINSGRLVKVARSAYTRQAVHRSTDSNHLTAQLLGYRPGLKDTAQELVNAFALGCFLARDSERVPMVSEEAAA